MNKKKYWELRAINFSRELNGHQSKIFEQHYWILKKIKRLNFNNFLEIGCGFGRNIEFFTKQEVLKNKKNFGFDF